MEPVTDDARPAEVDDDDDIVVLSWWQHPVNVIALVVATLLIGGMVGWLVADTAADPGGSEVDVGFLHDMRVHHDQAVQMSWIFLTRPDTDPGLRTIARSIIVGQSQDTGRMIQLLRDMDAPEAPETDEAMAWMGMPTTHDAMPGMATEAELEALGRAGGADADQQFVDLMVRHHQGGVHMAEFAATEADNAAVRSMASSLVNSQTAEIEELQGRID